MSDTGQHRHHHGHPDPDAYHWHLHDDHDREEVLAVFGLAHALSIDTGTVTVLDMETWQPTAFIHGEIEWREVEHEPAAPTDDSGAATIW